MPLGKLREAEGRSVLITHVGMTSSERETCVVIPFSRSGVLTIVPEQEHKSQYYVIVKFRNFIGLTLLEQETHHMAFGRPFLPDSPCPLPVSGEQHYLF